MFLAMGMFSYLICLILRDNDMDLENVSLVRCSISDARKHKI